MTTGTTIPDSVSGLASRTGRALRAQTLRSALTDAASAINAHHAQVLAAVIELKESGLHRDHFGFSALRQLLIARFDFTHATAGSIAAIARLSSKFRVLAQAALTGSARIDQVAYAVSQLDKTPAMRLFARTPFREAVASPFDPGIRCATPEAVVAQYCQHAPFTDLRRHLDDMRAALADQEELLAGLGEQSLQWIELTEQGSGMWSLSGELSTDTGMLLEKYFKTACPPPRQDQADTDGVLPPQPNRHAEALHQLIASYGTAPGAAKRHGHTATLDLSVDIATLQGADTGRNPTLEGRPISLARARHLACEAGVIPSVFDYRTGEAIELGRALRLPNAALRRKLELEQPHGCAWTGCASPLAWTEAHHLRHWSDGGPTSAENLILLCRFHHGRIHTPGWTVEKTGPGQAVITHHDHDTDISGAAEDGCGCADWRTDADMDAEHAGSDWDVFPTGLYRTEWAEWLKPDLDAIAEAVDRQRTTAAISTARNRLREKFTPSDSDSQQRNATGAMRPDLVAATGEPPPLNGKRHGEPRPTSSAAREPIPLGEPPFLPSPSRHRPGRGREGAHHQPIRPPGYQRPSLPARTPRGLEPTAMPKARHRAGPPRTSSSPPHNHGPDGAASRRIRPSLPSEHDSRRSSQAVKSNSPSLAPARKASHSARV
ncbi:HNH endonuclease signature motif containing protein [Glycomyces albidus]|nr:HNH endonuclease signature motif containing protein [Glycomyces albidus]